MKRKNKSHRRANLLRALIVFLVDRWAARPGGFRMWQMWALWDMMDEIDRRDE